MSDKIKTIYGIADCHGIESLLMDDQAKELPLLMLRAQLNPQRRAIVYLADITEINLKKINVLLEKEQFKQALEMLKLLSAKFTVPTGPMERFATQIPNPSLDPYHIEEVC